MVTCVSRGVATGSEDETDDEEQTGDDSGSASLHMGDVGAMLATSLAVTGLICLLN
jgi:hypothetical protein